MLLRTEEKPTQVLGKGIINSLTILFFILRVFYIISLGVGFGFQYTGCNKFMEASAYGILALSLSQAVVVIADIAQHDLSRYLNRFISAFHLIFLVWAIGLFISPINNCEEEWGIVYYIMLIWISESSILIGLLIIVLLFVKKRTEGRRIIYKQEMKDMSMFVGSNQLDISALPGQSQPGLPDVRVFGGDLKEMGVYPRTGVDLTQGDDDNHKGNNHYQRSNQSNEEEEEYESQEEVKQEHQFD